MIIINNNFWGGLGNLFYFFGILTLIMEFIVFTEFNKFIGGPFWSLGASVMWLLFIVAFSCFIVGANVKKLPIPEKYKK